MPDPAPPAPGPLSAVEDWPVDTVAAAVVEVSGVVHAIGDGSHPFALASVTKPLFATAALVAVEEEVLDLEAPAGPEGSTVRHLLAHASGLGLDGTEISSPGRRRIYSNAGYDELGRVLERSCGIDPATYLAEAVARPLGMASTVLDGSPASEATSTLDDMTRWVGELLAPGRVVAPETVEVARSVAFPGLDGLVPGYGKQSPNDWGLGFEVRGHKDPHWTAPSNSPETYGHFGRSGTFTWIDPVAGRALVVLTDREFGSWAKPRWPALGEAVLGHGA